MSDEETPDEQETEDAEEQRKASAQQAAADLDRMGIDPRALGLDTPPQRDVAAPQPPRPQEPPQGNGPPAAPVDTTAPPDQPVPPTPAEAPASVTPLRPEFAQLQQYPAAPPAATPPAAPAQPAAYQPQHPPQHNVPAGRQPTPVELLLARTTGDLPTPARPGGLLRSMSAGIATPDSAEASAQERELVGALRTRQTERRVVSFFAGKGGVGTTTILAGVGTAFAALRDEHTAAVDVRSGTASLGQLLGAQDPVTLRRFLGDGDEARVGHSPTGLRILDGVGWEQRLRRTDVSSVVERLGAEHTFTLLDVGNDASDVGNAAVARSDQTVIVGSAGRVGLAALEVAVARLAHTDPFAVERAVFVIVCHNDESYRQVHRETVRALAVEPMRIVVVPPDEVLASGRGFDPAAVRVSTRSAMLKIAAAIAASGGRQ